MELSKTADTTSYELTVKVTSTRCISLHTCLRVMWQ